MSRGNLARVVRISAELDDGYLTTYTCDGLIVSTATGSTGYALAVGGPVMPPELRNILVIPIAPHLSMDTRRDLVGGRHHSFAGDQRLSTDGDGRWSSRGRSSGRGSGAGRGQPTFSARFVRTRERSYFYQTLMDKMQWTT
ncbi:MAG: hypothetical protein V9G24_16245 [Rhodoblastus sp.]